MFKFHSQVDDAAVNFDSNKHSPYRMSGLRHNPYVGSFHNFRLKADENAGSCQGMMVDAKNNPLIGAFRHSPSASSGISIPKRSLTGCRIASPVISQLQISKKKLEMPSSMPLTKEEIKKSTEMHNPGRNFLASWKQIPAMKYDLSSNSAANGQVKSDSEEGDAASCPPVCSICIEPYADGDQLKTLTCSHCFHSECIGQWFFQTCLSKETESAFNCPECRQNHFRENIELKPCTVEDNIDEVSFTNGIAGDSFLLVGNYLRENTFDFVSDFDHASVASSQHCPDKFDEPFVMPPDTNQEPSCDSPGALDPMDSFAQDLGFSDLNVSVLNQSQC